MSPKGIKLICSIPTRSVNKGLRTETDLISDGDGSLFPLAGQRHLQLFTKRAQGLRRPTGILLPVLDRVAVSRCEGHFTVLTIDRVDDDCNGAADF
jgi:hypothetical protein